MKASPLQLSICVTCLLLLLAKLWDWWQGLGAAASSVSFTGPLPVVPETTSPPATAFQQAPPRTAPPADLASPRHGGDTPHPEDLESFELEDGSPDEPAPAAPPARPDFAAHTMRPIPRLSGPDPAEEASELQRQLADLSARELAAARLRGKSMLLNAETQARTITEDAERTAAAQIEKFHKTAARPPSMELNEARRQGGREGHAIGLRKGEIEALGRIEQVFAQIENLLDVPSPAGGSGGSRR